MSETMLEQSLSKTHTSHGQPASNEQAPHSCRLNGLHEHGRGVDRNGATQCCIDSSLGLAFLCQRVPFWLGYRYTSNPSDPIRRGYVPSKNDFSVFRKPEQNEEEMSRANITSMEWLPEHSGLLVTFDSITDQKVERERICMTRRRGMQSKRARTLKTSGVHW